MEMGLGVELLVAAILLETQARHWLAVEMLAATSLVETRPAVVKLEEETVFLDEVVHQWDLWK